MKKTIKFFRMWVEICMEIPSLKFGKPDLRCTLEFLTLGPS
jgi:hypothetical protein